MSPRLGCLAVILSISCNSAEVVTPVPPPPPPPPSRAPGPAAVARQQFSRAFSCPESRIAVTASDESAEKPPPEISADPERLAVWRRNHAADPRKVFDLTGCDHHLRLACRVYDDMTDTFCTPRFEPGETGGRVIVDVDPATRQKLLERLERSVPSGRPGLGVAIASVAGVGLVVGAVLPTGAAGGRLRAGDVIVRAGDEAVRDEETLAKVVQAHAGSPLDLKVRRDGQDATVTVDVPSY